MSGLPSNALFGRRAQLLVSTPQGGPGIDLSSMQFSFRTEQSDTETPNNSVIRVYNLSPDTVKNVQKFNRVILNAGYVGAQAPYGKIFDGDIKQFGTGRISATDTYLDIFAADGDTLYNYTVLNVSLEKGLTPSQQLAKIADAANLPPPVIGEDGLVGGTLVRGKVLYGMFRDEMRVFADSQNTGKGGAAWSIQNGVVQVIRVDDYLPGDPVLVNSLTGMIGVPEQTADGIRIRTLLNPKIKCGALMRINNRDINKLRQTNPDVPVPFNQFVGLQLLASESADGTYRVYVAEHEGDIRGGPWYTNIVGLAVNTAAKAVTAP